MNLELNPSSSTRCTAKPIPETSGMQQGNGLFNAAKPGHKPQICLPKGGEKELFIITGVEIAYIWMKRATKFMTAPEERWKMYTEQTYM